MPYQYNVNSPPQSGVGFAGAVPGAIDLPNPYQDIARHLPTVGPLNNAAGSDVLSQLNGQLSPETLARIQDASASFGITSGMPGSGLQRNRTARDLGLSTEQLQNQGLQNYGNLLNTVSRTQTVSPELQAEIAGRNATLAAAPNPAAAASHAQDLFNQYLASMGRGPQGGTGGGGGGPGSGGSPAGPTRSGGIDNQATGYPGSTGNRPSYDTTSNQPVWSNPYGGGFGLGLGPGTDLPAWGGGGSPWGQEDWSGVPGAGSIGMPGGGGYQDPYGLFQDPQGGFNGVIDGGYTGAPSPVDSGGGG